MRLIGGVRAHLLKLLNRPSNKHSDRRTLIVDLVPEGIGAALSGGQSAIAVLADHHLGRAEYVGI